MERTLKSLLSVCMYSLRAGAEIMSLVIFSEWTKSSRRHYIHGTPAPVSVLKCQTWCMCSPFSAERLHSYTTFIQSCTLSFVSHSPVYPWWQRAALQGAGFSISSNLRFSMLPKDSLTCGQVEPEIKPPDPVITEQAAPPELQPPLPRLVSSLIR